MSKEKEELVTRLLKEGKTFKEISQLAHVSYSPISTINKKLQGNLSEPNVRNQAYKMFHEQGKTPIEVAIAFRIDNVEATRYWKECLQLKEEWTLLKIRNEFEGNFSRFINLYREIEKKHYGLGELKRALQIVRRTNTELVYLSNVEDEKTKCQTEVGQLRGDITKLKSDVKVAKYEVDCLNAVKGLLLINVQALKEEQVHIKKRLTQLYSRRTYSTESVLVSDNNFVVKSSPSLAEL